MNAQDDDHGLIDDAGDDMNVNEYQQQDFQQYPEEFPQSRSNNQYAIGNSQSHAQLQGHGENALTNQHGYGYGNEYNSDRHVPAQFGQSEEQDLYLQKGNQQSDFKGAQQSSQIQNSQMSRQSSQSNVLKQSQSTKNFDSAYRNLIQSMAQNPNASVSGLISHAELQQLGRHQTLDQKEFLARKEQFVKQKEEKIQKQQFEKHHKDVEDCTFAPQSYTTKNKETKPRDLQKFLEDQDRYMEYKSINSQKLSVAAQKKEFKEVQGHPQIDFLSKQIVEMMTERQNEAAHDRLYKHGKDKLRTQTIATIQQNTETIQQLEQNRGPQKTDTNSPPRDKADLHRGKEALYQLHQQKLERNERAREQLQQQEALSFRKQTFKNPQSEELRIQGFKKEFRLKLAEVVEPSESDIKVSMPNPKDNVLEFGQVVGLCRLLGFISATKRIEAEDQQIEDLYTMFKCNTDQKILAENLQNVLMIISGQRDHSTEVQNTENNTKWMLAGVYDPETAMFYLREGEHKIVVEHFKLMNVNRQQQKKAVKLYGLKTTNPTFAPSIDKASARMAQQKRARYGSKQVDIVSILLHPETLKAKANKKEKLKQQLQEDQDRENTFRPKINKAINAKMGVVSRRGATEENNIDQYLKAQFKAVGPDDDIKVEKHSFKPKVNKQIYYDKSESAPQSVKQVKGMEKMMQRMQKARDEQQFKKKMTERSNFTATGGVKQVKKMIKKGMVSSASTQAFSVGLGEVSRYKPRMAGVDGSQIVPEKKSRGLQHSASSNLYLPKQEPKLRQRTILDIQSEIKQATFKPKINKSKPKVIKGKSVVIPFNGVENQNTNTNNNKERKDLESERPTQLQEVSQNNIGAKRNSFRELFKPSQNVSGTQSTDKNNNNHQTREAEEADQQNEQDEHIPVQRQEQQNEDEPEDDEDRDLVDQQLGQIGDYPIGEIDTRGDPKLYVDVNIGKQGGMERIVVYEGDTADGLAKEFCAKNGLNTDMEGKLKLLLEQQIAGVLPKINENEEEVDDSEDQEEADKGKVQDDDDSKEAQSPEINHDQQPSQSPEQRSSPRDNNNEQNEMSPEIQTGEMFSGNDRQTDEEVQQDEADQSGEEDLNEQLYDSLMASINEVWPTFALQDGLIDLEDFKDVMVEVAHHQGLYQGTEQDIKQNTIFFTQENLQNIFAQIQQHEQQEQTMRESHLISHSSVVDILYNVLNQIQENKNQTQ